LGHQKELLKSRSFRSVHSRTPKDAGLLQNPVLKRVSPTHGFIGGFTKRLPPALGARQNILSTVGYWIFGEILHIHNEGDPYLPQVALAFNGSGGVFGTRQTGREQRGQNRGDRDDDKKLDQREAGIDEKPRVCESVIGAACPVVMPDRAHDTNGSPFENTNQDA